MIASYWEWTGDEWTERPRSVPGGVTVYTYMTGVHELVYQGRRSDAVLQLLRQKLAARHEPVLDMTAWGEEG